VVGLQTVGVVLMSAMIVAPAAAARQWTDRLSLMVVISACFGALAGIAGATLSGTTERLPTGPTIIVCMSVIVVLSLFFAPHRGLVARSLAERRTRSRLRGEALLTDLALLEAQHQGAPVGHSIAVLEAMNPGRSGVGAALGGLAERGLVAQARDGDWALTQAGRDAVAARDHTGTDGEQP
jgi:manganese/zinc/iron transport system permease protein